MGPLLSTWFNFKNDMLDAKVLLGNKVLPKPMLTKFQGLEMSEGADELNSYNKEIFKGTKLSVWWSPTSRQSGQWCRNPSHGVSSSQFNGWLNMKVYLLIYLISIDLVLILLAAWQKCHSVHQRTITGTFPESSTPFAICAERLSKSSNINTVSSYS